MPQQYNQRNPRQAPRRPQQQPPKKRRRKNKNRLPVFLGIIVVLFLVAVLVTSLTSNPKSGVASSSLPVSSQAAPPSSAVPVSAALYDETEAPMLLNAQNPLPDGYTPELASVGFGNGRDQQMEVHAAVAFNAMKAAAEADEITLTPFSCYRSHERQLSNYNASIQKYIGQGYSKEKATEMTQQYYAIPGTSEHEAGFAVDINGIEESFENTPAFKWLQQNCTNYGFILRYPKDKVDITGIAYEPWHYRYVGVTHAKAITEKGITLEEYMAQSTGN